MMGVGLPLHSIMKFDNTRILTKQNISFSQKNAERSSHNWDVIGYVITIVTIMITITRPLYFLLVSVSFMCPVYYCYSLFYLPAIVLGLHTVLFSC